MQRYDSSTLIDFGAALLAAAELEPAHARSVAEVLVAADCLNRSSHGIAAVPRYAGYLKGGQMARTGMPEIVNDGGTTMLIEGNMLPGPVVARAAVDAGLERMAAHGTSVVVARRSHHIACLGAYLERATDRGAMILMVSSNPAVRMVAPFGGRRPFYSPNPVAIGIPTEGEPILVDFSTSSISANVCRNLADNGEMLSSELLLDASGTPTRDPGALFTSPPGALLPFGGPDAGYKGFALGIMVEALTSGLGGFGRSSGEAKFSNSFFVLLVDPARFGGRDQLRREVSWLADAAHSAGDAGEVRLPGEHALAFRRRAFAEGVPVADATVAALVKQAEGSGVPVPESLRQ